MDLSTLDTLCHVMDSALRPLDFMLIFDMKKAPDLAALQTGARSAMNCYPTTGSHIDGKQWVRFNDPDVVVAVKVLSDEEGCKVAEAFINSPFDLQKQTPVRQLVIVNGVSGKTQLFTRFHHAAADYISAMLWLRHQFGVAYGQHNSVTEVCAFQELPLRNHPVPVKKSRFSYCGPAHRLWCSGSQRSRSRIWHTIGVSAGDLRECCRKVGGFTFNDLLMVCALEVFIRWNRAHNAGRKVGILLPMNIRQQPFEGFGNGASRMRIYARYDDDASLIDKCREIRRQVAWCKQHGEWAVPKRHVLTRLPVWAGVPLLRTYLNRPWVDMATGVFSHAERWDGQDDPVFQDVEKIAFVGQLHAHQALTINGVTFRNQTYLTFTCDPGLLGDDDLQCLIDMYQKQIARSLRELI